MAKNNIRSFRYSDKVARALESFEGSSFNEKFENLVLYCFDKVPETKKRLESLNDQIKRKNEKIYEYEKQIRDIDYIFRMLGSAKQNIEIASRSAKQIADKCNIDNEQPAEVEKVNYGSSRDIICEALKNNKVILDDGTELEQLDMYDCFEDDEDEEYEDEEEE